MKKLVILDFEFGAVHFFEYPENVEDLEKYITDELYFSLSTIQWMCADRLEVYHH